MIILDTNVLSELMRDVPNPAVLDWLDRQPSSSVWVSCISLMEIRFGLFRMPTGKRRERMLEEFEAILRDEIQERYAPFDASAATQTATLMALRNSKGRPMEYRDAMIAGTALSTKAVLATRNTSHFSDLSVSVVNPWQ
jgi:predicted nucleic acid-binding protein